MGYWVDDEKWFVFVDCYVGVVVVIGEDGLVVVEVVVWDDC